jgi:radical SAM-linked protein
MVFSTPLSVGTQSLCEYLDIRIDRDMSCEDIVSRLNAEMTDEFHIVEAYEPINDFSEIAWATYKISITTAGASNEMAEQIQKALTTSPIILTKKTKAGEKDIDIIPLIASVRTELSKDGSIDIETTVSASTSEYLNPEMLITGLKNKVGILLGDPTEEYYSIMRTELLKRDMTKFS